MTAFSELPGFWSSPLQSDILSDAPVKMQHLQANSKAFYFLETRPQEKGRSVAIQGFLDGLFQDITQHNYSIKTRVNEYGGQCYAVNERCLVFFDLQTLTLYVTELNTSHIKPLFYKENCFFADLHLDAKGVYLYAVMEDKSLTSCPASLVRISLETGAIEILHATQDFYAQPTLSPCGKYCAFLSWNHPNMPWDENILWYTSLENERFTPPSILIKKPGVTCDQLLFSSDSILYFTCDANDYSQLYQYHDDTIVQLSDHPVNFGINHWVYGVRRITWIDAHHLALIGTHSAKDQLYLFNTLTRSLQPISTPFTLISEIVYCNGALLCVASTLERPSSLYALDIKDFSTQLIKSSQHVQLDMRWISKPQSIQIPTLKTLLHGFYYPPCNPEKSLTTLPPLIVKIHSGPTSHVSPRFQSDICFFTSRGFAYFELNYRGSSGYSKTFQHALQYQWGKYDIEDVITSAEYLIEQGLAHPHAAFLKGSSAGGFTLLAALTSSRLFAGGVCYYGVCDLLSLAEHTHKFEKHYLDQLIGPLSSMQHEYQQRSPLHHVQNIKAPTLFFHGKKDAVVAADQTLMMHQKLKEQGIFSECILFEDEGHGFRQEKTLTTCLVKELEFYQKQLQTLF